MKKILSFVTCLLFATATLAAVDLDEGQVWWGFYTEDMVTTAIGEGKANNYNCAIRIDGDDPTVKGCVITAIRFPLVYRTSNIRSAKVWVGTALPAEGAKADVAEVSILDARLQGMTDAGVSFNEVKLKEPVTIPEGGLYVGFSLKVKAAERDEEKQPIVAAFASGDNDHACYYYSMSEKAWTNRSADYTLALQVAVSGGQLPTNAASAGEFIDVISESSAMVDVVIPVKASGTVPVSDIDCQLLVNGQPAGDARHCTFSKPIANFASDTLHFTVQAPARPGNADCALLISQVNGLPNERPEAVHAGNVAVLSQQGLRHTVMEEFTGAWCAWCPRGAAAMQMLADAYGDRFIGIAIHRDDPMQTVDYDVFMPQFGSFPGAVVNRAGDIVDPYLGVGSMPIGDIIDYTLNQRCEADLQVEARWHDDATNLIDIDAATTFRFSTPRRDYALALVAVHNGLTGTGDQWTQKNNYSGNSEWADKPYMQPYTDAPGMMEGYAFDHVAIAARGIERGITGSITSPIVADEIQHFNTAIDLTGNALLQEANRVGIVAMLIYRPTGQVVNAAHAHVAGREPSAISTVKTVLRRSAVFTVDGRRHASPVRGLNIITDAEGHAKKGIFK